MNINDLKLLDYKDIVVGMRVFDMIGNEGIVKECDDIHNILVEYDSGGTGFHCLLKGCIEDNKITINGNEFEIEHYYPLYQIK